MKKFYILFISIFILSILFSTPFSSTLESSENFSEKILEEESFQEDKYDNLIDSTSSWRLYYHSFYEIPLFIKAIKISSYLHTHFRPPILL